MKIGFVGTGNMGNPMAGICEIEAEEGLRFEMPPPSPKPAPTPPPPGQDIHRHVPAEASLIEVDGKNRWKTIIQNASLNQISRQVHVDSIQRLELDHQE